MAKEKKKALVVFGTRPETIKMASVVKELEKAEDTFETTICTTGQHRQILDQMLPVFGIQPDIDLNLMEHNQTLASISANALLKMVEVIKKVKPDVTLVQGDTTTAFISGLASFYEKVAVGHVEAGLRTSNRYDPFPEEINRRLLGPLTNFHFAPTQSSAYVLLSEGFPEKDVFVTGNTVIDALLMVAAREEKPNLNLDLETGRYILVTAHRRENFGQPILNICQALKEIALKCNIDIVYPVHPNPNISGPVKTALSNQPRVHLIAPLQYEQFVFAMKGAYLMLSDSGGVQEEAPSLGKPVLVLRKTTERPEAVQSGVVKLVGTDTVNVVKETELLINSKDEYQEMAKSANPFGDGQAAKRIVEILAERL